MNRRPNPNCASAGAPWTDTEDAALVRLRKSGLSFAECAAQMPGRGERGCKSRYCKLTAPGADENGRPFVYGAPNLRAEHRMLSRLSRDGGFPELREVKLRTGRYGVRLGSTPVVADGVMLRWAA